MEVNHLNPQLRDRYRIKNTHLPRVLQSPVGDIDFRTLNEDQAAKLCSVDFYYLERLPDEAKPKVKKAEAAEDPTAIEPDGEAKPEIQE